MAHPRRAVARLNLPIHLASPHPHRASSRRGPACCLFVLWLCAAGRGYVRIRAQELLNLDARGATAKEGVPGCPSVVTFDISTLVALVP